MDRTFARIISYVFEPLLVIILMVFGLIYGRPPQEAAAGFVAAAVGLLLPGVFYVRDYLKSRSQSLDIGRKDRNAVYLAGVLGFTLTSIIFVTGTLRSEEWFYLSMLLAVFFAVFYMVNLYFDKASAHTGTFTFALVVLAARISPLFALGLVVLPIIIWARLKLHKHEWAEIMWGLIIGLTVGMLAWGF